MNRRPVAFLAAVAIAGFVLVSCQGATSDTKTSGTTDDISAPSVAAIESPTLVEPSVSQEVEPSASEKEGRFDATPIEVRRGELIHLSFPAGTAYSGSRVSCWKLRQWSPDVGWQETRWQGGDALGGFVLLTSGQAADAECTLEGFEGPEDLPMPENIDPGWYKVCGLRGGICSNAIHITS